MKIYVMTDLECTAGVVTLPEYCLPSPVNKYGRAEGGRHYDHARELATLEVNAAVDGLLDAGATDVLVCDGHGPGGLNASLIHPRARVLTGRGGKYPRGMDATFDAAIMVGQHARANTDGGHLCHSGSFSRDYWGLNGQEIGEIALFMVLASSFDVPVVMISGDAAACAEARALVPSIETVTVIEGERLGGRRGMTTDQAIDLNVAATHVAPPTARQMVRQGAARALGRAGSVERYRVDPPYEMVRETRRGPDTPARRAVNRSDDFVDLLNQPTAYEDTVTTA